jgi:dTDP-4-dehydrorhamnose reductase
MLITGASGQLGRELTAAAPADSPVCALARRDLDITDTDAIAGVLEATAPDVVINAAAYTAVDRAEHERARAFAVNERGAANLARVAAHRDIRLIHVSTDFVFDGQQARPYEPGDTPNPLGSYGESKLAGEASILDALAERALIVRTGWVYSAHGRNFVDTMLRLMHEKEALRVVCDQVGTPTWAAGLASVLWVAAGSRVNGILHWSDAGLASWYDFAVAIQEEASAVGLLEQAIPIAPVSTAQYPIPAQRPPFAVLDKGATTSALGQCPEHWRVSLRKMMQELRRDAPSAHDEGTR